MCSLRQQTIGGATSADSAKDIIAHNGTRQRFCFKSVDISVGNQRDRLGKGKNRRKETMEAVAAVDTLLSNCPAIEIASRQPTARAPLSLVLPFIARDRNMQTVQHNTGVLDK